MDFTWSANTKKGPAVAWLSEDTSEPTCLQNCSRPFLIAQPFFCSGPEWTNQTLALKMSSRILCEFHCHRPSCELGGPKRSFRRSSLPLVFSETRGPLLRSSLAASKTLLSSHQSSHQKFRGLKGSSSELQLLRAASCSSSKQENFFHQQLCQGLLANPKAEDNRVSTELLTLQGLHWATSYQQGQYFSTLGPTLPSLDPQTRNHRHPPSRTGNVELGLDSIILARLSTGPLTLVTCQMYSGLYKC